MDTAGCDAICLLPGVRGTSGGRDGEEKKMAPWAPRLMLVLKHRIAGSARDAPQISGAADLIFRVLVTRWQSSARALLSLTSARSS